MTAVILTGGEGKRLRPLTCEMPKALIPVRNKPVICYTAECLEELGFSDIIISADRCGERFKELFGAKESIRLLMSQKPEGASDVIARAAGKCGGEAMVIIPGDILFDFDLKKFHDNFIRSKSSEISVLGVKTDRFPENAAALTVENGMAKELILNPPGENSGFIFTGILAVSKRLAEKFPAYGDVFEEALSNLIKDGDAGAAAFIDAGFFLDINVPADFIRANMAEASSVFVADSARICEGAKLTCGAVIGENVYVGKGASINGGIIMNGAYIGEGAVVNRAVVGEGARLLNSSAVYEGAVIGAGAHIYENAEVKPNSRIWNSRVVETNSKIEGDLKYGVGKPLTFDEEGITGETNGIVTPQTASVIGSSLVGIGPKIGIGYKDNSRASHAMALSLVSGVMSAGGEAWLFGECTEPELAFCVKESGLSAGCYADAGITAKFKFVSSDGLPLKRGEESAIEAGINRNEYKKSGFNHFGGALECSGVTKLYRNEIYKCAPKKLTGIKAVVNASSRRLALLCDEILSEINDRDGAPVVFHISADGREVSAYTDETGYVFHDKLILLCCQRLFKSGRDAALPYSFPTVADDLARMYGCVVLRYSGNSRGDADKEARELAAPFVTDGAVLMFGILDLLSSGNVSLSAAMQKIPEFATVNRYVPLDGYSDEILKSIGTSITAEADGAVISDTRGRILISPVRTGKGVMMRVESYDLEIAAELCDFYQDIILNHNIR